MKKRIIIVLALLLVTALLCVIYLRGRDNTKSGEILVKTASGDISISLDTLSCSPVNGTITNKKGETKEIDSEGVLLFDIPSLTEDSSWSEMKVYADDEYNAVVSKDETEAAENAWLIKNDGSVRLVVFGDKDSKRDVKNVVQIEIK